MMSPYLLEECQQYRLLLGEQTHLTMHRDAVSISSKLLYRASWYTGRNSYDD